MGQEVVKAINETEEIGKVQADILISERALTKISSINAPEKQELKKCVQMFFQLYIASEVRRGDIRELFNRYTRKESPSLAKTGEIRGRVKVDLLSCINTEVVSAQTKPWAKVAVLEWSVSANNATPGNEKLCN